jgi:glutamyl-tRNA synthetase
LPFGAVGIAVTRLSIVHAMIKTRFAPSPSGHLHVGGARTALFNWVYTKARGGAFILRIEDTDQKRSSDAASVGFLNDLKWLGIEWDEGPEFEGCGGGAAGPYFQSQRLDTYARYAERLLAEGKAYRAFETPEDLDAARRQAMAEKRAWRYDRAALKLSSETVTRFLAEGRPHVIRLRIPDSQSVTVHDQVLGDVITGSGELDDFVIIKADGYPTYHFAVVVDDELMGVTHVIRAQEHLNNTPRHVLLQQALGFRTPAYAHISIIQNPDGSKMSKRDKDKALRAAVQQRKLTEPPKDHASGAPVVARELWDWWLADKNHQLDLEVAERLAEAMDVHLPEINVDDFRRAGYLPEVLVNYLALLGWSPGGDLEKFDINFLLERFDLDRIIKSPAKFDREKLLAFNLDAIQLMGSDEFVRRFREHCAEYYPEFGERLSPQQLDLLARANQARCKTLDDPIRSCRFFILNDDQIVIENSKSVRKALAGSEPSGYTHLEGLLPILRGRPEWTATALEQAVHAYAREHAGGNLGQVAQPLRIAVSGSTVSPPIFETLVILGRDSVLHRIGRCLANRSMIAAA